MASRHGWKIELIPWDHLNPEHVQRMYDQRVACGWREQEVPEWIGSAKKGRKMFYWALFADALPGRDKLIEDHIKAYPKESNPLTDTARAVRLVPRQPTDIEFIPIGHVAIDIHEPEEDEKLGLPATGTVWVHQLYVSRALHGGGFGAGTMSKIESLATQSPMNAKIIALDTLSRDMQTKPEKYKVMYGEGLLPLPAVPMVDWYSRLGYEIFKEEDAGYLHPSKEGVILPLDTVYMKKVIA
ncbi:hypothetical protein GGR54DRAFT_595111 [Hypoxylon sp. NC1633]|nr:hypothetical protein GGR54DRAFT_595111 [Hypoxylon sp. NC1633]